MNRESIDWTGVNDKDFVLWYRRHTKPNFWRYAAIGSLSICHGLALSMVAQYPRRSVVILPKFETPILETVQ